jgi:hypothetical protein
LRSRIGRSVEVPIEIPTQLLKIQINRELGITQDLYLDKSREISECFQKEKTVTVYAHEIILTSGSQRTVPADWDSSDNEIDVIGGGGGGGNGTSQTSGGGGAFSAVYDVNLTPGQTIDYGVGQGGQGGGLVANDSLGNNGYAGGQNGGDTWFGGNGYSSAIVAAKGGQGGAANTSSGAPGGQASQGIGTLKTSGGTGTYNYVPPDVSSGAGGGGAGGPNGNGGDGGQVLTAVGINSDSGAAGGGAGDGGQNGGAAISGSGDGSAGGASITGAPGGAGGKASSPNGQPGTNGSGGGGGYGDFATE